MIVECIPVTEYEANCYVVVCPQTREGFIVDPGGDPERIMAKVSEVGAKIKYIVITHGHFDHIGALPQIKEETGAIVAVHPDDVEMLNEPSLSLASWAGAAQPPVKADLLLGDGDEIVVGTLRCRAIHTPGHTPGGVCILVEKAVFVGDVLFYMGIGRTDFPGGDYDLLIDSIKTKLLPLGDETRVYPGHGPATTIGLERENNPWLVGGGDW